MENTHSYKKCQWRITARPRLYLDQAVGRALAQMAADPSAASVEHVCGWLASIGMPQFAPAFKHQLVCRSPKTTLDSISLRFL
jgi:hypothetical protein